MTASKTLPDPVWLTGPHDRAHSIARPNSFIVDESIALCGQRLPGKPIALRVACDRQPRAETLSRMKDLEPAEPVRRIPAG